MSALFHSRYLKILLFLLIFTLFNVCFQNMNKFQQEVLTFCSTDKLCENVKSFKNNFTSDIYISDTELENGFQILNFPILQRNATYKGNVPDDVIAARRRSFQSQISCANLLNGDTQEQRKAHKYMNRGSSTLRPQYSDANMISVTSSPEACQMMRRNRGYFEKPLSSEEYDFSIAFSILLYKDVSQVERLLRAIYQPQNWYCLHVDSKASRSTLTAAKSLASCFPNVFVAKKLISVHWGHISIMQAEYSCIKELLHKPKWKYFINLSAQMFPLQTNLNLVKILKMFGGANDIEGTYKRSTVWWMRVRQWFSWYLSPSLDTMLLSGKVKDVPPYNITIYKGSNQVAITREFAAYFVHSRAARDITGWFSDTLAPDEYIWPSLNHNPQLKAPGGFTGDPEAKKTTARASIWSYPSYQVNWSWDKWKCKGKFVRQICIFGIGDLPWLKVRPEMFANKFHRDYEWLAYDCMEELMFNRTVAGSSAPFHGSYYGNLSFVKHPEEVIRE